MDEYTIAMRFPSDHDSDVKQAIRDAALEVNAGVEDSREKSIVLTKLEEAHMWAAKL